jgi:hypothetical protein
MCASPLHSNFRRKEAKVPIPENIETWPKFSRSVKRNPTFAHLSVIWSGGLFPSTSTMPGELDDIHRLCAHLCSLLMLLCPISLRKLSQEVLTFTLADVRLLRHEASDGRAKTTTCLAQRRMLLIANWSKQKMKAGTDGLLAFFSSSAFWPDKCRYVAVIYVT